MKRTILINVFSFILTILSCSHAVAFHSTGKIDDTFSHSDLKFYPPIPGRSACYLEGKIKNESGLTHENVSMTIYAYDFFDHALWQERIYINIIEPYGKHSFSERMYNCSEPSQFKFKVSGVKGEDAQKAVKDKPKSNDSDSRNKDLGDVDLISIMAREKDKLITVSFIYKNKDKDKLIFWEGQSVYCECELFEATSSSLKPSKGNKIHSFSKKIERFSQDIYIDLPSSFTAKTQNGQIECMINTGNYRLKASNDFTFSDFHPNQGKSPTVLNPQDNSVQKNNMPDSVTPVVPIQKYLIILTNGKEITTDSCREHDNTVFFYKDGGEIQMSKDKVSEIRKQN